MHRNCSGENHGKVMVVFNAAGKETMTGGPALFNKAASSAYQSLEMEEKERLLDLSVNSLDKIVMTAKDIKKKGSKIFSKIQNQV